MTSGSINDSIKLKLVGKLCYVTVDSITLYVNCYEPDCLLSNEFSSTNQYLNCLNYQSPLIIEHKLITGLSRVLAMARTYS